MANEKTCIRISVRNLVESALSSGDIDNRQTSGAEKDAMQAGSKIYRKIQRRMGANYQAEVTMEHAMEADEFQIAVERRADGVTKELTGGVTIDEIKGVYTDIGHLEAAIPAHQAQAMCYGYFHCYNNQLDVITIQATYCNIEMEEIRRLQVDKTFEESEFRFQGLIHEYLKWATHLYQHGIRRKEPLKELDFPYSYREGQKEPAVSVYCSIVRGKNLFIQAPTGVGETLSTVYPGLKAMGEGYAEKLSYLVAKIITRSVAGETFIILQEYGLYFRTVTITAKGKLCFLEKSECNLDVCPYAKEHYDRVNDAVYETIHRELGIIRETMLSYVMNRQVRSFEFCLDIANWVDGIVCNYNYVLDLNVRSKRYFAEGVPGGRYLSLVDEAHNLVSYARGMSSAQVTKEDFLLMKKLLKGRSPKLVNLSERCNEMFLEMKQESDGYVIWGSINLFVQALMMLSGELETFIEESRESQDREQVLDFYFEVRNFLGIFDQVDDNCRAYTKMLPDGRFMLRLFCINPARNLAEYLDKGQSTAFFSATLLPVQYYEELFSGNLENYTVCAKSPPPEGNRLLTVASDASSKYTRRNQQEYKEIVLYIKEIVRGREGNYMVSFPSYQFLRKVEEVLNAMPEEERTFHWAAQESKMREQEWEVFPEEFESFGQGQSGMLVALCVIGGVFSEGIDLKEDRLIGAITVGIGLPMVRMEQDIPKNYLDEKEKQDFDFAYQYPGMNKVMQAAGRVIRTMEDKGIILPLDERSLRNDYQTLFPGEWGGHYVVSRDCVGQAVEDLQNGVSQGRDMLGEVSLPWLVWSVTGWHLFHNWNVLYNALH